MERKGSLRKNSQLDDKFFTSESIASLLKHMSLDKILSREKELEKQFEEKYQCYHHQINRTYAEKKLKKAPKGPCIYLVRQSTAIQGDFVLSMLTGATFHHFLIERQYTGVYSIKGGVDKIIGVDGLLDYYKTHELGLPQCLGTPCKGKVKWPPACRAFGFNNCLHRAISEKKYDIVLKILKNSNCSNVNAKDENGDTALHKLCRQGNKDVVENLLKKKVDVTAINKEGLNALMIAAKNNHPGLLKMLIVQGGADPQDRHHETFQVAMHYAASKGHTHCIKELLLLNAAAHPRDVSKKTPLEMAKNNGYADIVNILDNNKPYPAQTSRDEWYHGKLDRQGAVNVLNKAGQVDGLFLVRDSSREGSFVLALKHNLNINQFEIKPLFENVFLMDGPILPSLEHLIEYYSLRRDGLPTRLMTGVTKNGKLKMMKIIRIPKGIPESYDVDEMDVYACPHDLSSDSDSLPRQRSIPKGQPPPLPTSPLPPPPTVPDTGGDDDYAVAARSAPPGTLPGFDNGDVPKLDAKDIKLGPELGQGEFGSVMKGYLFKGIKRKSVAIKTLHEESISQGTDGFFQEANVMIKLNHPCIVKLIGVSMGPPIMMVQELVKLGSMLDFLLDYPGKIHVKTDLYLWAHQIASGMEYLENKGFVHRDLAARNILLESKKQAKVGDFGLSRAVGNSDYYKASVGGRWPVKWYAPESINYGTFSSASDVWSYGVTLWEMFSLGEQPYDDMKGAQVLEFIEKERRLSRPERCPEKAYNIMLDCWKFKASERPTFSTLNRIFHTDPEYEMTSIMVKKTK